MSAGSRPQCGIIEGQPIAVERRLAGVPVAGWARSRHADGRSLVTVEPLALIVAGAAGTRRIELGDATRYPSQVDAGYAPVDCTEAERVAWLDAAFGPPETVGAEWRLPFRRVQLPAEGSLAPATTTEIGVLRATAGEVRVTDLSAGSATTERRADASRTRSGEGPPTGRQDGRV